MNENQKLPEQVQAVNRRVLAAWTGFFSSYAKAWNQVKRGRKL